MVDHGGPAEVAGWPDHLRRAWFGGDGAAVRAGQAYDWIRLSAHVEVCRETLAAKNLAPASRGTVVPRLPPLTRDAVLGQVQASFTALHDITVGDVLKLAWSACQTLRRVARESLATSRRQAFHLDGYVVPVEYQPAVDVLVGGKCVATIYFGLCLTLELFHIDGIADRGRLVRLQTQTFDVTASLTMAGRTLASRKTRLNLAVEFPPPADGLPLVRN